MASLLELEREFMKPAGGSLQVPEAHTRSVTPMLDKYGDCFALFCKIRWEGGARGFAEYEGAEDDDETVAAMAWFITTLRKTPAGKRCVCGKNCEVTTKELPEPLSMY